MRVKTSVRIGVIAAVVLIAALLLAIIFIPSDSSIEFTVTDALTGGWVWGMTASTQNKIVHGFYQSDGLPVPFKLTGLKPKKDVLLIQAPNYESRQIPLHLKRGANVLSEPIALKGVAIEDLDAFFVFEKGEKGGWTLTLRAVNSAVRAIENHPPVPLLLGVRIHSWESSLQQSVEELNKQQLLYQQMVSWQWDSTPETQFRLTAFVNAKDLAPFAGNRYVFEYAIFVPTAKAIEENRVEELAASIPIGDDDMLQWAHNNSDLVTLYTDVSWDVQGSL